jgi:hypothetical protein
MGLKDMVCSRKLKVKFYEIICKSVTIHSEFFKFSIITVSHQTLVNRKLKGYERQPSEVLEQYNQT